MRALSSKPIFFQKNYLFFSNSKIRETKNYYIIDATENEAMTELRQRAEMYADTTFPDYWENGWQGVVLSAKATLRVIGKGPR